MIFGSDQLRLCFDSVPRFCCASVLVVAAFGCVAGSASASIITLQIEVVEVDAFLAHLDQPESSTSTLGTAGFPALLEQPAECPDQRELCWQFAAALSPNGGSTSTSSTSSAGGAGAAGNMPIHYSDAATSPDLELVGWTNGEARFFLPSPPGNDLLRPPRFV